jgi:hypothetical protein
VPLGLPVLAHADGATVTEIISKTNWRTLQKYVSYAEQK